MFFLMAAILICGRWYLIMILIWISLIISYVEHLFIYLLAICISSLEEYLFSSSAHFQISSFLFWGWAVWLIYILDINPLLVIWFTNVFPYSLSGLFILLMVSFTVQKPLHLSRPHFFISTFISFTLRYISKKIIAAIYVKECSAYVFL